MTVASPRLLPSTKLKGDMIHRSLRDGLDFKKCVIVAGIPALFAAQPASVFPRGGLQKRRLFQTRGRTTERRLVYFMHFQLNSWSGEVHTTCESES